MEYKIPKIMAILNVTPDSFSDGGENITLEKVKNTISDMITYDVAIIDIGAESTRYGAEAVSCEEEIRRLSKIVPYVKNIVKGTNIKVSLDSRNFETIAKFINDIDLINDVSFGKDERILDLVRDNNKQYCFYFSTSVPVDKNKFLPVDTDVIGFFQYWFNKQVKLYKSKGIREEQLIFDPGIGFSLNASQSLEVIKHFDKIKTLGIKTLIGHSRKSFLSIFGEQDASKRDLETHIVTAFLVKKNVDYIRVHNFAETQKVLRLLDVLYN